MNKLNKVIEILLRYNKITDVEEPIAFYIRALTIGDLIDMETEDWHVVVDYWKEEMQ